MGKTQIFYKYRVDIRSVFLRTIVLRSQKYRAGFRQNYTERIELTPVRFITNKG